MSRAPDDSLLPGDPSRSVVFCVAGTLIIQPSKFQPTSRAFEQASNRHPPLNQTLKIVNESHRSPWSKSTPLTGSQGLLALCTYHPQAEQRLQRQEGLIPGTPWSPFGHRCTASASTGLQPWALGTIQACAFPDKPAVLEGQGSRTFDGVPHRFKLVAETQLDWSLKTRQDGMVEAQKRTVMISRTHVVPQDDRSATTSRPP